MARDPLEVLARLRRLETRAAQRHLAERLAVLQAAESRLQAATQAPAAEAATDDPAAFGAWLPRALAERERAGLALHQAEASITAAREALAVVRAAERAIEMVQEGRMQAARRARARREQAVLDDMPRPRPATHGGSTCQAQERDRPKLAQPKA